MIDIKTASVDDIKARIDTMSGDERDKLAGYLKLKRLADDPEFLRKCEQGAAAYDQGDVFTAEETRKRYGMGSKSA